jgi:hypothetical protein
LAELHEGGIELDEQLQAGHGAALAEAGSRLLGSSGGDPGEALGLREAVAALAWFVFITVVTLMVGRKTFRFPEAWLPVETLISRIPTD